MGTKKSVNPFQRMLKIIRKKSPKHAKLMKIKVFVPQKIKKIKKKKKKKKYYKPEPKQYFGK